MVHGLRQNMDREAAAMIFRYLKIEPEERRRSESAPWLPAKPAIQRAIQGVQDDGLARIVTLVVEPYKERCRTCGGRNVISSFDWYRKQPIIWCVDCGKTWLERRREAKGPGGEG
jgi:hypothetical protein